MSNIMYTMDVNDDVMNSTLGWMSEGNDTLTNIPLWKQQLHTAYRIILTAILVLIMVGMGCNVSLAEIWKHLRRPYGFAIGAFGQFVMLPLLAFSLAHALSLERKYAIGLLIISTCPGGAASNIFTYWFKGNISLSISMTTVSTLLSFGTMPFNLWLYSRSWTSKKAAIPFLNIVITLVSILGPVIVGMLIKWRSEKAGKIVTKIGSISGVISIWVAIVMQFVLYPSMLRAEWRVIVASTVLPLAGLSSSYFVAFLLRRTPEICRTIAVETGSQNVPMAISVITLSYSFEEAEGLSLPTTVYGTMCMAEMTLIVVVFYTVLRCRARRVVEITPEKGVSVIEVKDDTENCV